MLSQVDLVAEDTVLTCGSVVVCCRACVSSVGLDVGLVRPIGHICVLERLVASTQVSNPLIDV